MREAQRRRAILFDWGDTLMRDLPGCPGPMATWPVVKALPHAREVLTGLRSRWVLALATNAADSDEAGIRAALRRGGLGGLLDRIYCRWNVGHRKPSPAYFEHVLADLRLPAEAVVMVGDDFTTDVLGANGAGVRAIWLNEHTGEERVEAMHRTIHDLRALPGALLDWQGGKP